MRTLSPAVFNSDGNGGYIVGNHLTGCLIAPSLDGGQVDAYARDTTITTTNTVNGLPVYFFKNTDMNNASVPTDCGEILLFNVTHAEITGLNMEFGSVLAGYCSNLTIEDDHFAHGLFGDYLFATDHCIIRDNIITEPSACGIVLFRAVNDTISGNTIDATDGGKMGCILMEGCLNTNVSGNHLIGGGFEPMKASSGLSSGGPGMRFSAAVLLMESNHNRLSGNVLTGGSLLLEGSEANLVDHNTVTDAPMGIFLSESINTIVSNNTITNSTSYGIIISDGDGNTVFANVLNGNNGASSVYDSEHVQAIDFDNNTWNIDTMGNFWSDWQSPDANQDGIVDVPYVLDGGSGAQDLLPMVTYAPLTVSISSPSDGSYRNTSSVNVTWTVSDALATVEISTDGTAWTDVTGTTSHVLTLNDGAYVVYVRATDNRGHSNTSSVAFTVDTVKALGEHRDAAHWPVAERHLAERHLVRLR